MNAFFHNGGAGDLLYGLIAIKARGGGSLYLSEQSCHTWPHVFINNFYGRLKRLCEHQPYIHCVERSDQAIHWMTDLSSFNRNGSYAQNQCITAGVEFPGFEPWLTVPPWNPFGEPFIVINRTARYRKDGTNYAEALADTTKLKIFIGSQEEWTKFQLDTGVGCAFAPTEDLYAAARLIAGADALYCNGSACLVIAQGMGTPYYLENGGHDVVLGLPGEHILPNP